MAKPMATMQSDDGTGEKLPRWRTENTHESGEKEEENLKVGNTLNETETIKAERCTVVI